MKPTTEIKSDAPVDHYQVMFRCSEEYGETCRHHDTVNLDCLPLEETKKIVTEAIQRALKCFNDKSATVFTALVKLGSMQESSKATFEERKLAYYTLQTDRASAQVKKLNDWDGKGEHLTLELHINPFTYGFEEHGCLGSSADVIIVNVKERKHVFELTDTRKEKVEKNV
jgi:hypothetical protein